MPHNGALGLLLDGLQIVDKHQQMAAHGFITHRTTAKSVTKCLPPHGHFTAPVRPDDSPAIDNSRNIGIGKLPTATLGNPSQVGWWHLQR
jgi:hypothetical protein